MPIILQLKRKEKVMIGIQEGSYKASCPDVYLHNLCHHSYMLHNVSSLEKKKRIK